MAKDCKTITGCKECENNRHVAALHPGSAPWIHKRPDLEHGREQKQEESPDIISKCTEVSGENNTSCSWSKICLIEVHLKEQPSKSIKVYAVLDNQSNRSLARSEFLFFIFTFSSLHVQNLLTLFIHVLEQQRCWEEEELAS